MKNRILQLNNFRPGDLEAPIETFVDHHSLQHDHECINNGSPADDYFDRDKAIISKGKGSNERH